MANNAEEMIRKLQICAPYTDEPFPFKSRVLVGPTRSGEIRRYFRRKARLNLDKIADSRLSTWEKTLTITDDMVKNAQVIADFLGSSDAGHLAIKDGKLTMPALSSVVIGSKQ